MDNPAKYYAGTVNAHATVLQGEYIWNISIRPKNVNDAKEILTYLDQKRGKLEGPGLPRQLMPEVFVNRWQQIERIKSFFFKKEAKLLFVCGIGGIGKSVLVRGAIEAHNSQIPVIWINCQGIDIDRMLLQLNAGFNLQAQELLSSKAPIQNKIELTIKMAEKKCILILDGFEGLLDDKGCYQTHDIESLVEAFSTLEHNIKVIITSRRLPANTNETSGAVQVLKLKGLENFDAKDYFLKISEALGLTKDKAILATKSEAFEKLKGHPKFIEFFALALRDLPLSEVEEELLSTANIGQYIVEQVLKGLNKDELGVLEAATIFRNEFEFNALKLLCNTLSGKNFDPSTLRSLIRESLVENITQAERYYVHPLIREALDVKNENRVALHSTAADWYLSKPITIDNLQNWDEGLYHLWQAAEIGRNKESFEKYRDTLQKNRVALNWLGWGRRVETELRHLSDLAYDNTQQVLMAFEIAMQLEFLGEENEAIEIYRNLTKDLPKIQPPFSKEDNAATKTLVLKLRLADALALSHHTKEANQLADELQPFVNFLEDAHFTMRYSELRYDISRRCEPNDPNGMLYWGNKRFEIANEQYKLDKSIGRKDSLATAHNDLAFAYMALKQLEEAAQHMNEFLKLKIEIGNIPAIAVGLFNLGAIIGELDVPFAGTYLLTFEQIVLETDEKMDDWQMDMADKMVRKFLTKKQNIEDGRTIIKNMSEILLPYYERGLNRRLP